ncbi:MAG: 2Fe-2S iron-sulfur cluster binding domain-containing protein, partial [Desulfuromonadales bacterium]|nr:2Fe-2S iron-sulfur cluster binding domain-containing protein [Desulfuromonadales bacterium]
MSDVRLTIDGKEVTASRGMTLLDAAQSVGIAIPTLCHHPQLEPYGGCRICTVEAEQGGVTRLVASCIYQVAPGLVVRTRTEKVNRIRKVLLEEMLAHAPESEILLNLAQDYAADKDR